MLNSSSTIDNAAYVCSYAKPFATIAADVEDDVCSGIIFEQTVQVRPPAKQHVVRKRQSG